MEVASIMKAAPATHPAPPIDRRGRPGGAEFIRQRQPSLHHADGGVVSAGCSVSAWRANVNASTSR